MAKGGFKAFCVDVNAVSGGGSLSDIENVLSDISQGIVDTDQGWSFDASKTSSSSSFVDVGAVGKAQFLTHSSGARLCIAMIKSSGSSYNSGFDIRGLYNWELSSDSFDGVTGGLMMSIIPPSRGDFDISNITTYSFLPNSATRLTGFGTSYSSSFFPMCFVERDDMDGKIFRYMVAVRNDVLLVSGRRTDSNSRCWFYAIGNIINCARNTDSNTYGVFSPRYSNGSNHEGDEAGSEVGSLNNSADSFRDWSPAGSNGQIYAQDGGLLSGKLAFYDTVTTIAGRCCFTRHTEEIKTNSSNFVRFTSIQVYADNSGQTRDKGVVAYDTYKGQINPEIIVQTYNPANGSTDASLSLGASLDGGNYIHLCNGVCIGWDSSNTVTFWG